MATITTEAAVRYPQILALFNRKASKSASPLLNEKEGKHALRLVNIVKKQNYTPKDIKSGNGDNQLEKFLAELFLKFRNFHETIGTQYRKVIKAIEDRTGVHFDKTRFPSPSESVNSFTIFNWLSSIISDKRTNLESANRFEEAFSFLAKHLNINMPFTKGISNQIRASLALTSLCMSESDLLAICRPYLDHTSKILNHIEESPFFTNKLRSAIPKLKHLLKSKPQSFKPSHSRAAAAFKPRYKERPISLARLGINYLIALKSQDDNYYYCPIQTTTSQAELKDFESRIVRISLGHNRLKELKTKVDNPIITKARDHTISFKRKIPGYAMEQKDISEVMTDLKSLINESPKIKLDKPFSESYRNQKYISNTDFIAALINQGFLIPVEKAS